MGRDYGTAIEELHVLWIERDFVEGINTVSSFVAIYDEINGCSLQEELNREWHV